MTAYHVDGPVRIASQRTNAAAVRGLVARTVARLRLSPTGMVVADLLVCLSLTPSLLPRTWFVQGMVSGVSASVGYGVGVGVGWVWRRATEARLRLANRVRGSLRVLVSATAAGLLGLSVYYASLWQSDLHALLGETRPGRVGYLRVLLVSAAVLAVAIGSARAVRALDRLTTRILRRRLAARSATTISAVAVGLALLIITDHVLLDGFNSVALSAAADTNRAVASGAVAPASATRSGSPQSLVSWDSLGREGRSFVSGGPSLAQLEVFTAGPAKEPIRVYVGVDSTPSIEQSAALAVRELERTDAASRAVLCVVTSTGTGWIDPYAAAALEYMAAGDTAMVSIQYSYLPSWISFLNQREVVARAGRALFESVYAYWSALPPGHRPRLLAYGESLGSYGSESAFSDLGDVLARTSGALWMGPTDDNPLWSDLLANRDAGSSEVLPLYGDGCTVRFASRPQDVDRPTGSCSAPRVVYLQNASDPVTWWSPSLLFDRPDWLAEPRGYDVSPTMRWYPVLTFLQVTADLVLAQRTRTSHGHYFHGATVAAWAAILTPPGWTAARTAELTELLDAPGS
jgi:uncharacterized membrane protein